MISDVNVLLLKLEIIISKLKWLSRGLLLATLISFCLFLFSINNESESLTLFFISIVFITFIFVFFFERLKKKGTSYYNDLVKKMNALSLGENSEIQDIENKTRVVIAEFINVRNIPFTPKKFSLGFMIMLNALIVILWITLNSYQNTNTIETAKPTPTPENTGNQQSPITKPE